MLKMSSPNFYRLRYENVRNRIEGGNFEKWWVAERVGIHRSTLRRWLSGRIENISAVHVERLAETLDTKVHEIADAPLS